MSYFTQLEPLWYFDMFSFHDTGTRVDEMRMFGYVVNKTLSSVGRFNIDLSSFPVYVNRFL